jgi:hypothetical protein
MSAFPIVTPAEAGVSGDKGARKPPEAPAYAGATEWAHG